MKLIDALLISGILLSDSHRLSIAAEEVRMFAFDPESPNRRLIKSLVLAEQPANAANSKASRNPIKRETDWIVAGAKETLGEQ